MDRVQHGLGTWRLLGEAIPHRADALAEHGAVAIGHDDALGLQIGDGVGLDLRRLVEMVVGGLR